MAEDRFGNPHAPGLPYAHGAYIRSSKDDHAKLRHAWRFIDQRVTQGWLPVAETPITVSPARASTSVAVITAAVWRLKATIPCAFASPPR